MPYRVKGGNPETGYDYEWYDEPSAAPAQPMMGVPGQSTAPATPYGGNYQYNFQNIQNAVNSRNAPQTDASLSATGDNSTLAGNWYNFLDNNGQQMSAWANGGQMTGVEGDGMDKSYTYAPNTGYRVFKSPGDMGGTGFTGQKTSRMNGIPYDVIDANGNYLDKGVFSGFQDDNEGDAMGVAKIIAMALGAGMTGVGTGPAVSEVAGVGGGSLVAQQAASDAAAAALAGQGAASAGDWGPPPPSYDAATMPTEAAVSNPMFNPNGVQMTPEGWTAEGNLPGEWGPEPPAYDASQMPTEMDVSGMPQTPSTFNPAQDSQLANEQLNLPPNSTVPSVTNPATGEGWSLPPTPPANFNPAKDSQAANEALDIQPDPNPQIPSVQTPSTSGPLDSIKNTITEALSGLGMTAQQAAALGAALVGGLTGGGNMPSGTSAGQSAADQAASAKQFLETVMPYVRYNSENPFGTSTWTRGADGSYKLTSSLNGANKALDDASLAKLTELVGSTPTSSGTGYSDELANTIFDRTWGMQQNDIDQQRQLMAARLAEQGFVVGNEGYNNEMNRWEDQINEARQKASKDAQIQAFTQGTQQATADSNIRSQMAQLLAGARASATGGLDKLTSAGSAPTGSPANATTASQNAYTADLAAQQAKNAQINDFVRALMNWGFSG